MLTPFPPLHRKASLEIKPVKAKCLGVRSGTACQVFQVWFAAIHSWHFWTLDWWHRKLSIPWGQGTHSLWKLPVPWQSSGHYYSGSVPSARKWDVLKVIVARKQGKVIVLLNFKKFIFLIFNSVSGFLCVGYVHECSCLWRLEEAIGFSGLEWQVLGSHLGLRSWISSMF